MLVLAEGTPAKFNPSQWRRLEQLTVQEQVRPFGTLRNEILKVSWRLI